MSARLIRSRPAVAHNLRAARRRVLLTRVLVVLLVAGSLLAGQAVLEKRAAGLRDPAVALGSNGQVFRDAASFLSSVQGQLALILTRPLFPNPPGSSRKVDPRVVTVTHYANTNGVMGRHPDLGTANATGVPVVSWPDFTLVTWRANPEGGVVEVTVDCSYWVCWDTEGTVPVLLEPGVPQPASAGAGIGRRYAFLMPVRDRLVMYLSLTDRAWGPLSVERLEQP